MSEPTIVIVPGAWVSIPIIDHHYTSPFYTISPTNAPSKHVPAHFSKVTKLLETSGYSCIGVELPCNSAEPYVDGRLVGISDDQSAIRATILSTRHNGHIFGL